MTDHDFVHKGLAGKLWWLNPTCDVCGVPKNQHGKVRAPQTDSGSSSSGGDQ